MDLTNNFKWDFKSEIEVGENTLTIKATPLSDYFVNPADGEIKANAPYYYIETNKDFTLKTKVTPNFKSTFDACALMVVSDETCYIKLCFELTDLGTKSVVSVVTNGVSDDANGVDLNEDTVYLQVTKKDKLFGLHYSLDGKEFKMVRYFSLPVKETVKLGFVAQSPTGEGGSRLFEDIQLDYQPVKDFRKGI